MSAPAPQPQKDRRGRIYTPAVGPRLRPWLWVILGGFALLGANGAYLASVTVLQWSRGGLQETPFYYLMFALHLVLGIVLIVPFVIFGLGHLATSWRRPNQAAVRYGLALLATSLVILISGLVLVRLDVPLGGLGSSSWSSLRFEVRDPTVRAAAYWLHIVTPILAVVLYVRHRLAGPRIRWEWARAWCGAVAVFIFAMAALHAHDPRAYGVKGPKEGKQYFFPSEAVTATGNFIPAEALMMDEYCMKCHQDVYDGWFHSAHRFSSFNNKFYLTSVRETRQVSLERDGNTQAARWCAGCHDPVPFFSGEFDDPYYDDVNTASSQAGLTCTSCHSVTHVGSSRGNADYTIEEPQHYPFAYSDNPLLQWVNHTLVKAKPEMHKQTFLKPEVHRDSKFCSTCHKVSLPFALNHYKDFLRGQNHWDTFLLSGVSGHGARSFYYPEVAKTSCVDCHMTLVPSNDFAARDFDGTGGRKIHNHLFLGANTGVPAARGQTDIVEAHAKFLQDNQVRIDIFGLRAGGTIEGELIAPLRPEVPTLRPGAAYLVETVVRTLGVGHPLTQGTADSNEIWVELIVRDGERVIGRSGGIDDEGTVDPYAHFINVYMLDRHGNRIDRRNPQDIFVPLYNKQIPPGAGQVVHFALEVPEGIEGPITLEAKVNYRKFDRKYMDYVFGAGRGPELPVVEMARDTVQLPVEGGPSAENEPSPIAQTWQRWNDYGIGLFLEGGDRGGQKGELKQAEPVFQKVAELGRVDGWVNLARIYLREGRLEDARRALEEAANHPEPAAPWVVSWLTGQLNERNGYLDEAIESFEAVLTTRIPERKFDFSLDYEVNNALGSVLYQRARLEFPLDSPTRYQYLKRAIATYRHTLALDSENIAAHYGLGQIYGDPTWRVSDALTVSVPNLDELLEPEADATEAAPVEATITTDALTARAQAAADPQASSSARASEARLLADEVVRFVRGPRPRYGSRLDPLHEIVATLSPAWDREPDPAAREALTRALEASHKALHALFKPDETAEGRAVRIARQSNPAANMNAQSIVIHPLHRPGAPGIDAPPTFADTATEPTTTSDVRDTEADQETSE